VGFESYGTLPEHNFILFLLNMDCEFNYYFSTRAHPHTVNTVLDILTSTIEQFKRATMADLE
jgi:hypothetical protein